MKHFRLTVTFRQPPGQGRVVLFDREGKELESHAIENRPMHLAVKQGYAKVCDGACLVDAFDLSQPLLTVP